MDDSQPLVKEHKTRHAAEVDELEARTKMWVSVGLFFDQVSEVVAIVLTKMVQEAINAKGR